MIVTSRGRTRQPAFPAEVALGNDLTRGTATGLLAVEGGVYETARGVIRKPAVAGMGGSLGIRAGREGWGAAQIAATSDWWDLEPGVSDPTTGPYCAPTGSFTILALVERYGNARGNAPIFGNLAPSSWPYYTWGIADDGGIGTISLSYNSAGTLRSVTGGSIGVGTYLIIAKRDISAGTHAIWINGAQRVSAADATGAISYFFTGGFRGVALGNFYSYLGDLRSFNGAVNMAWLWSRALSDQEIVEVSRNPWQLFAPVRRPVFFVSAGGVYDVALSESASASDSLGAAGALTSALAEAASAADVVSAAAAFAAAMSEVATATDGTAAVSVVLGALTEGGTGVDTLTSTISGAGVYDVALLESATTADAETAGGVFYVSVSEQGVGSEALSTGGVFYVTLADSGTGTDVLSGHLPTSFSAALSESVSALDVMVSTIPSAGTLWTAMDTAAASGWTAVATTTNTWTIVPTT